jgi:hypothetical protein
MSDRVSVRGAEEEEVEDPPPPPPPPEPVTKMSYRTGVPLLVARKSTAIGLPDELPL